MQRDTSATGNHVHQEAPGCLLKGKKISHREIKIDNSHFLRNIAAFIVTCLFLIFVVFFKSKHVSQKRLSQFSLYADIKRLCFAVQHWDQFLDKMEIKNNYINCWNHL